MSVEYLDNRKEGCPMAAEDLERSYNAQVSQAATIIGQLEILRTDCHESGNTIGELVATRIWEQKQKDTTLSQAAKEEEKREIELAIDEYLDLIPKTKSESVKSRYEAKIEQLDKRLAEINIGPENKKAPDINEALKLTKQFLGTPAETWKKASLELKSTIHRMIFTQNPTYPLETGFGTPKLSLPFYIKQHLNNHSGDLVEVRRVALLSKRLETYILQV